MEWSIRQSANAKEEIENTNYPQIRLLMFQVTGCTAPQEKEKVIGLFASQYRPRLRYGRLLLRTSTQQRT